MPTHKQLDAIHGGLSKPSKMPGYSYGLPAKECMVGSRLRKVEGSVCHGCYALKGMYVFPVVQKAQYRRLRSITDPLWTHAMVESIRKRTDKGEKYFRWHDSGDLQSVEHLSKIAEVCRATENVSHWLPTREYAIVRAWLKLGNVLPVNLNVRLSAHMVDGPAPVVDGCTSNMVTKKAIASDNPLRIIGVQGTWQCPAPTQDNECKDCRACWSRDVECVAYVKH